MNTRTRTLVVRGLGVTRMAVGVSTYLLPRLAPRSLGVATTDGGDGGTVARMFGIRDAALAAATLSADPAVRSAGLRLGVVADLADTVAVLRGRKSGVSTGGAWLIGGAAAFFALAGIAVWPQHSADRVRVRAGGRSSSPAAPAVCSTSRGL